MLHKIINGAFSYYIIIAPMYILHAIQIVEIRGNITIIAVFKPYFASDIKKILYLLLFSLP